MKQDRSDEKIVWIDGAQDNIFCYNRLEHHVLR